MYNIKNSLQKKVMVTQSRLDENEDFMKICLNQVNMISSLLYILLVIFCFSEVSFGYYTYMRMYRVIKKTQT